MPPDRNTPTGTSATRWARTLSRSASPTLRRKASSTAVAGTLEAYAWFLILFLWQFPHFYAIAWMYRGDYARAGIRMLPVVDPTGSATFGQIIFISAILVPVSLLPAVIGLAGSSYFFGAFVIGLLLLEASLWASRSRTSLRAKWLMHATVAYIPLLLGLLMFDKVVK